MTHFVAAAVASLVSFCSLSLWVVLKRSMLHLHRANHWDGTAYIPIQSGYRFDSHCPIQTEMHLASEWKAILRNGPVLHSTTLDGLPVGRLNVE